MVSINDRLPFHSYSDFRSSGMCSLAILSVPWVFSEYTICLSLAVFLSDRSASSDFEVVLCVLDCVDDPSDQMRIGVLLQVGT